MNVLLALPAIVVTAVLRRHLVRHRGGARRLDTGGIDWAGLALITAALGLVMGGLVALRLDGAGAPSAVAADRGRSASRSYRSSATSNAHAEPIVDVRLLAQPAQWPVQLTAFLFGMSVLGAQIPLSTFARTDPAVARLRARCRRGLRLHPDRGVRRLPGHRRVHPAADRAAARRLRGALVVVARCSSPSATCCGCPSTTAPGRR